MRKIEFGIKYLKENKRKLLFNFFYILVVAVSFYALNFANVIVSDFYPFAFGLLFALFWSGVNPYLLSIIYFLAGILSDSSEMGIYLALNPSIVVFLAGFLHKKIHKTPKLWVSIFYSLLSQIMFVISNYGNIRMFLYSFLAVAFGIGFMLVVVNFLRATVKRGFNTGLNLDEQICGAIIFAYDMDKFIPAKLLEIISKYKITTFCAPPTMYRFMLQEDLKKYDLSSIQRCCTAGEPLNPEVIKKWQEYTGHFIYEGFGQSEGSVLLANFQWFEPRLGSTGKPSPIYDIHLVDKDGNDVKTGEEGSIVVMDVKNHPPVGLFTGYYKNPEMTEEKLLGKFYNTDDMASCDEDGYYCFIGRDDDVIKCSGYRIGPFEVESALLEHPSVVECAITGAPDPIRGQVVKATVVLAAGYTPSEELKKELQNHVKRVTAPYKYPRVIEFVDELPKTLGGKIKRGQIRKSDEDAANK